MEYIDIIGILEAKKNSNTTLTIEEIANLTNVPTDPKNWSRNLKKIESTYKITFKKEKKNEYSIESIDSSKENNLRSLMLNIYPNLKRKNSTDPIAIALIFFLLIYENNFNSLPDLERVKKLEDLGFSISKSTMNAWIKRIVNDFPIFQKTTHKETRWKILTNIYTNEKVRAQITTVEGLNEWRDWVNNNILPEVPAGYTVSFSATPRIDTICDSPLTEFFLLLNEKVSGYLEGRGLLRGLLLKKDLDRGDTWGFGDDDLDRSLRSLKALSSSRKFIQKSKISSRSRK